MTNYEALANLYQEDVDLGILDESLANELNDITYDLYTEGKIAKEISKDMYKGVVEAEKELILDWLKKNKKLLIATGVIISALIVLVAKEQYKFDKEFKKKEEEIKREHEKHKKEFEEFEKRFKERREINDNEMNRLQNQMKEFNKQLTKTYNDAKEMEKKYDK
jgi:uncharacterized membrane-anchored protein YhcB (DUF1043 family)